VFNLNDNFNKYLYTRANLYHSVVFVMAIHVSIWLNLVFHISTMMQLLYWKLKFWY